MQQQASQPNPPPTSPLKIDPEDVPSLDILLDLAKERIKEENDQISALDTKAGFALGSASLLTAGVAAFQQTVFDISGSLLAGGLKVQEGAKWAILVLATITLVFYLALVFSGYQAYRIRKFQTLTEIADLVDKYLTSDPIFHKGESAGYAE